MPQLNCAMSWISPTFSSDDSFIPPPPKKTKSKNSKCDNPPICNASKSCNWLEKYRPKTVSDLIVNVKKIKEVEDWLQQAVNSRSSAKILLVTGPSGSGKTATLQTVCKSLNIKVLEWITPLDRPFDDYGGVPSKYECLKSAAKQFEEYVFRSSRYNSCLVSQASKNIIMVKDFPNVFIHNPSSFQEVLERLSEVCINPIVFVCSDESLCRKLFSITVKDSLRIQTITFNPITDQKASKFLKSLLSQEVKVNKNVKSLPDEAILTICVASQGDLRGAVSKLYFCSISSDFEIAQLKPTGKLKKSKQGDVRVETDKDKRLDFFHGIGRVLYPKKVESDKVIKFVHSTNEIVENFLSEPKSFLNQLHENYPSKMGNLRDLSEAAERLSKSDMLMSRWQEKEIFPEYSLSVAIQGVMVSNRHPQKAKFEAFRKSQTSRLEIDTKALELEGKAVFSDLLVLEYERLIEILPYYKDLLPNLTHGQQEYVRKTCYFK
ncbi:cell cycle checkpoint protein RAD17-like [Macrosteles quadrilineatus]|uniref:cell cycle checkpoint protein RAD17-like n=1 Tax=Macrosteles quadrilineatus TaxID=74068 RepID=UPI0023E28265|nr:cell cycle checkpoint protein RAD17-like [Macrosteles quadrilineatus]XP_054284713.1 cell cycle checkpoint protein RAD17-like [Macrosteles quadrilineatus]